MKVGNSTEKAKKGNRGKRDSQLLMFNFFSRIYYKDPLQPMDQRLYEVISDVILKLLFLFVFETTVSGDDGEE